MEMSNNNCKTSWESRWNFSDIKNRIATFFPIFLLIVSIILASATLSQAVSLSIAWNPNSEADLAGYKLYYDNNLNGDYQNVVNVGMVSEYEITNLPCGTTYRIAMSAYDVNHNESELSTAINISIPQPDFKLETGEISVNHDWIRITYSQSFTDPVVVANCLSNNDDSPVTIRIRNVDKDGFEIRLQEWEYLEQSHEEETVSYLVMERGHFTLDDGTVLESGSFTTDSTDSFGTVNFCQSFNQLPVIMTTVASINEPDAVVGRLDNINLSSFDFCLQEQGLNDQIHTEETISFIAWEPSQGNIDGLQYEIGRYSDLTDDLSTISFNETYNTTPHVLANLQTTYESNPANLRYQYKDTAGIELKITEEQSSDSAMTHVAEDVGFMVFAAAPPADDENSGGDDDAGSAEGGTGTPNGGTTGGATGGGTSTGGTTGGTSGGTSGGTGGSTGGSTSGGTTGGNTGSNDKPANLFNSTLNINSGTIINVTINGGTEPYAVTSANDAIATATIVGKIMTITGIAAGTVTLTITDAEGNSGQIVVNVKTVEAAKGNPNTPMTPVNLKTMVNPTQTHIDIAEGKVTIAPQLMVADGKSIAFPIMFIWIPEAGFGFDISKLTTAKYRDGVLTINLGTIDFSGFPGIYDIFYGYIDIAGHIHYNAYELTIK